ncbi:hypothetical protein AUR64_15880 [Haloprofundus marisrubri]|uniref:Uncharacterized protein n=1 Tax=Haloprofundus marisrubri TaxID=1514971 RepID=A0A0W1R7S7_9EURY|nr:hypothetical protein [Haloprofundus marisrubri]KTG09265.1 hypothetical protein AUR64_15880 [Haloprofundus marisrubri]
MDPTIQLASVLAAVNMVFLALLTGIWVRNYLAFRTPLVLGLVAFGAVMFTENALALYYFFSMTMLYSGDPTVQQAVTVLRGLQLVALGFLTYVTLQ